VRLTRSRLLLSVVIVGLAAGLGTVGGGSTAGAGVPGSATNGEAFAPRRITKADRIVIRKIRNLRDSTWRWQDVMFKPRTPYSVTAEKTLSRDYRSWALRVWKRRAKQAWRLAQRPPHYEQWLCIHRYEGSWTDPNAPYYGGLQMDLSFQRAYGAGLLDAQGTADHWSPLQQMWVAERAHAAGRGFYPWPNTARFCGLL
jgi:hypothetical protein